MILNEETIADELRAAGLKATPQRIAVVRALAGDDSHPTAQQLYERLRQELPGLAFATVYNTLGALIAAGRLSALTPGGATRFDPNIEPHDHAICDVCGAIQDLPITGRRPRKRIEGFEVARIEHIYRGVCESCRQRSPAS